MRRIRVVVCFLMVATPCFAAEELGNRAPAVIADDQASEGLTADELPAIEAELHSAVVADVDADTGDDDQVLPVVLPVLSEAQVAE